MILVETNSNFGHSAVAVISNSLGEFLFMYLFKEHAVVPLIALAEVLRRYRQAPLYLANSTV